MIIVEGPDGAGKSTLVGQLCNDFRLGVGERAARDRRELYLYTVKDTFRALTEAIVGHELPKVWDRLFYSELVYGPILRGACQFHTHLKYHIEDLLDTLSPPTIICLPSFDTVRRNVERTTHMDGVMDRIGEIYRSYQTMSKGLGSLFSLYDYEHDSTDVIYEEVSRYVTLRRSRAW